MGFIKLSRIRDSREGMRHIHRQIGIVDWMGGAAMRANILIEIRDGFLTISAFRHNQAKYMLFRPFIKGARDEKERKTYRMGTSFLIS